MTKEDEGDWVIGPDRLIGRREEFVGPVHTYAIGNPAERWREERIEKIGEVAAKIAPLVRTVGLADSLARRLILDSMSEPGLSELFVNQSNGMVVCLCWFWVKQENGDIQIAFKKAGEGEKRYKQRNKPFLMVPRGEIDSLAQKFESPVAVSEVDTLPFLEEVEVIDGFEAVKAYSVEEYCGRALEMCDNFFGGLREMDETGVREKAELSRELLLGLLPFIYSVGTRKNRLIKELTEIALSHTCYSGLIEFRPGSLFLLALTQNRERVAKFRRLDDKDLLAELRDLYQGSIVQHGMLPRLKDVNAILDRYEGGR